MPPRPGIQGAGRANNSIQAATSASIAWQGWYVKGFARFCAGGLLLVLPGVMFGPGLVLPVVECYPVQQAAGEPLAFRLKAGVQRSGPPVCYLHRP